MKTGTALRPNLHCKETREFEKVLSRNWPSHGIPLAPCGVGTVAVGRMSNFLFWRDSGRAAHDEAALLLQQKLFEEVSHVLASHRICLGWSVRRFLCVARGVGADSRTDTSVYKSLDFLRF